MGSKFIFPLVLPNGDTYSIFKDVWIAKYSPETKAIIKRTKTERSMMGCLPILTISPHQIKIKLIGVLVTLPHDWGKITDIQS